MVEISTILKNTMTGVWTTRLVHWSSIAVLVVCVVSCTITGCFAQGKTVKFRVVVPASTPKESKIYIAGNHPLFGDWNPGLIELKKVDDSVWAGKFDFESGTQLEYKVTRGNWSTQAIYEPGIIPGNRRLVVTRDTEVVVRPLSWSDGALKSGGGITGTVRYHRGLKGEGLRYARDLIVWLPPSYQKQPSRRFPVLYMHDGQNIVDPGTSFIGYDWKVDEVADSLIRAGLMQGIIVVGIYNSPDRMVEYSETPAGKSYANFVVHTVKPLIDSTYRTLSDPSNTAVMGSSMGGLISFLFAWWYPDVFSKAGCLSSVFADKQSRILKEVEADNNGRKSVKIYMDCGGYGEETTLKPGMDRMVSLLKEKGYREGVDFESYYDPSAEHSERAWAARIWRPLLFFFGTR